MQVYLPGIPPDIASQIAATMQRPVGTVTFWNTSPDLLDRSKGSGLVMQVVIGSVIFMVSRNADLTVEFLHATPGTGTRRASIDLSLLESAPPSDNRFFFALAWSPEEMRLHIGTSEGHSLLEGRGEPASFSLQVGRDGSVVRVGDEGVQVRGARMYSGGQQIVGPSAIELWKETRFAVETLLTGESQVGYLFETVLANAALAALVTGFETYGQQRFLELEREGITADFGRLVPEFLSKEERERFKQGQTLSIEMQAQESGRSRLELLAEKINFQNYESAKGAFNRGYGLRFGDLPVASQLLQELQRLIRYRHRIIHVSPLLGYLNADNLSAQPYFSNRSSAVRAVEAFSEFILALHEGTLALRPSS